MKKKIVFLILLAIVMVASVLWGITTFNLMLSILHGVISSFMTLEETIIHVSVSSFIALACIALIVIDIVSVVRYCKKKRAKKAIE